MNEPDAHAGRPERRSGRRPSESSQELGRPAPRFVLVAELEELPYGRVEAFSHEDERRMRATLESSRRRLHQALDDVLDQLGEAA